MAASDVIICNKALLELGEEPITLLTDTNKRAEKCNLIYASVRDSLLSSHPWKFALKRVQRELNTNSRFTLLRTDGGWTQSPATATEYYLPPSNPLSFKEVPDDVYENDVLMTPGTLGSLVAGEWAFGDQDTLGFNTIYVRLSDSTDPDTKFAADNNYLEAVYDTPAFSWSNAFPIPSDTLRIWEMKTPAQTNAVPLWDLQGEKVLSNNLQINMRYGPQFTDTTKFDILYEDALVFAIAAKLAIVLLNKRSIKADMIAELKDALSLAKKYNAIESNIRFEKSLQTQRPSSLWQTRGHGIDRLNDDFRVIP